MTIRAAFLAAATLALAAAAAPAATPTIAAAVADPGRPAADTARDGERKPAAMLEFAGVKPGMTVIEFMPGAGYFTRLFSTAVGPQGRVFAWVPDEIQARMAKAMDALNAIPKEAGHANVVVTGDPLTASGAAADIVWTSQNYHDLHNRPNADLMAFNQLAYRALKPGGVYLVLDHAAAPGSGLANTADLHRIDPAAVRKEVEAAGFRFVGESKVLANRADTHTLKVFDPAIRGRTDQFVLKFRKPR